MTYILVILIILGILVSRYVYKMHKEAKRIAYVFELIDAQDIALNKAFTSTSQDEADSAWIDVELMQLEINKHIHIPQCKNFHTNIY